MGKTTNQMTKCSIEVYEKRLILVVLYVLALYRERYIHKIPKGIYLGFFEIKTTYEMAKYYDVLGKKAMNNDIWRAISLKILLMLYAFTQLLERKIIMDDSDVGKFGYIEKMILWCSC